MRTLLACFPHPDDETFATGGTLARARRLGIRTALWIATDGEGGHSSVEAGGPAGLALTRRRELLAAAAALGVDAVHCGGLPDGALATLDPAALAGAVAAVLRQLKPGVVLGFGDEGGPTRHPDHRALAPLVRAAAQGAGAAFLAVAWRATGPGPARRFTTQGPAVTHAVELSGLLGEKRCAFAAHRSQAHHQAEFDAVLSDEECFALAPGVPLAGWDDLFRPTPPG